MTDLAEHLGEDQAKRALKIVEEADFTKCAISPETKTVYLYLISGMNYLVEKNKNEPAMTSREEITILGGKLLSVKGITVTGRDVVLLCLIGAIVLVVAKEMFIK